MSFIAHDVALVAVRSLRGPLAAIALRDSSLADQLRRAAASVPLNLAESRSRRGKDRTHLCRIAAGSAREARSALQVAIAFGYLDEPAAAEADAAFDRVLRLLWPLVKP